MINQSDIDKYRQIKAPNELRQRIIGDVKKNNNKKKLLYIRSLSAIAACFVVVMVCWNFFKTPQTAFTIDIDTSAYSSISDPEVSRVSSALPIKLVVAGEGKLRIKVQDDDFYYLDKDSNQLKLINGSITKENEITLVWNAFEQSSKFTVNGQKYKIFVNEDTNGVEFKKIGK